MPRIATDPFKKRYARRERLLAMTRRIPSYDTCNKETTHKTNHTDAHTHEIRLGPPQGLQMLPERLCGHATTVLCPTSHPCRCQQNGRAVTPRRLCAPHRASAVESSAEFATSIETTYTTLLCRALHCEKTNVPIHIPMDVSRCPLRTLIFSNSIPITCTRKQLR